MHNAAPIDKVMHLIGDKKPAIFFILYNQLCKHNPRKQTIIDESQNSKTSLNSEPGFGVRDARCCRRRSLVLSVEEKMQFIDLQNNSFLNQGFLKRTRMNLRSLIKKCIY